MVGLGGGREDSFRVTVLRLVDALHHHARDAGMAEARSRSREQEEPVAQGGRGGGAGWRRGGGGGGGGGIVGSSWPFLNFILYLSYKRTTVIQWQATCIKCATNAGRK